MIVRRQISIPDDIDDYLASKNASGYIVNLIRADMENNKPLTKEYIIKLIQEYTATNVIRNSSNETDTEIQSSIGDFLDI